MRTGVTVTSLSRSDGRFALRRRRGDARTVGRRGHGRLPAAAPAEAARDLPENLLVLDADDYHNEAGLPVGGVLVVGSGQTGCQIAEELVEAGRTVFLSCGRAPWAPRRIGDHDLLWWMIETGFLDVPVDSLPEPSARLAANVLASGRDGGHDLHLRTLRAAGVTLLGHLVGADETRAHFARDLPESIAWGDDRYRQLRDLVHGLARERGLPSPELPDPEPVDVETPEDRRARPAWGSRLRGRLSAGLPKLDPCPGRV